MYRDRENGWVFGVCAGIAQAFKWNVWVLRALFVAFLLITFLDGSLAIWGAVVFHTTASTSSAASASPCIRKTPSSMEGRAD
mgnify:CR=1 FL=1